MFSQKKSHAVSWHTEGCWRNPGLMKSFLPWNLLHPGCWSRTPRVPYWGPSRAETSAWEPRQRGGSPPPPEETHSATAQVAPGTSTHDRRASRRNSIQGDGSKVSSWNPSHPYQLHSLDRMCLLAQIMNKLKCHADTQPRKRLVEITHWTKRKNDL